VMKIIIIFYT